MIVRKETNFKGGLEAGSEQSASEKEKVKQTQDDQIQSAASFENDQEM